MQLVNGKVVMGRKDCNRCKHGKIPGRKTCAVCQGTGNGKRGARGQCKNCSGYLTKPDFENTVVCPTCQGQYEGFEEETSCDTLQAAIFQAIPIKVYRSDREQTRNEALIGLGCLYSCTDYGRSENQPDEYFIDDVRSHSGVQATKVTKEDGTLCSHIGVFTNQSGYSVRAVFTN